MPRKILLLGATLALAASAVAFAARSFDTYRSSSDSAEVSQPVVGGEPPATISVPTRWASGVANDLATLTANSDAVFVGRVMRLKGQREEALVPGVVASASPVDGKPIRHPGTFPISTFEVHVQQAITGEYAASSVALIEQAGGISVRADGSPIRLALEGDQPLEPGRQYLFFARTKGNGSLSVAPFARLVLTDHGLQPLVRWEDLGALATLSGKPLDEATALVQSAGGR